MTARSPRIIAAVLISLTFAGLTTAADTDLSQSTDTAIRELDARGILSGTHCSPGEGECEGELLRWEAFVWIARVIGATPAPHIAFTDVRSDAWWSPLLQGLFDRSVVWGCRTTPLEACADRPTTRAQMASLIVRSYGWPVPIDWRFVDVPRNWTHAADIEALAHAGITQGCADDPAQYCPHRPLTRQEGAVLLYRLLGAALGGVGTSGDDPATDAVPTSGDDVVNGEGGGSNGGGGVGGGSNGGGVGGNGGGGNPRDTFDPDPDDGFFPPTRPSLWTRPYTGSISCLDWERQGYLRPDGTLNPGTEASIMSEHSHEHGVTDQVDYFNMGHMIADGPFQNAEGDWVVSRGLWGHRHFNHGTNGVFTTWYWWPPLPDTELFSDVYFPRCDHDHTDHQ